MKIIRNNETTQSYRFRSVGHCSVEQVFKFSGCQHVEWHTSKKEGVLLNFCTTDINVVIMGGGQSYQVNFHAKSDAEIMKFMLPLYYTTEHITDTDMDLAHASWNLIVTDTSPKYLDMEDKSNLLQPSCISWFYTTFYNRLFDVHPACKPLFHRGIIGQGNFLVKMISLTLNQLRNPKTFQSTMESLAERHCEWGVRGVEYGIVGDVLFYSLYFVLGNTAFDERVQKAWWRIYSAMLTHILPICVRHERDGTSNNLRKPVIYAPSTCPVALASSTTSNTCAMSIDDVESYRK